MRKKCWGGGVRSSNAPFTKGSNTSHLTDDGNWGNNKKLRINAPRGRGNESGIIGESRQRGQQGYARSPMGEG